MRSYSKFQCHKNVEKVRILIRFLKSQASDFVLISYSFSLYFRFPRGSQNYRLFYGSSGVKCGSCGLYGHNRRSSICSEHRYSNSGRSTRYHNRCVARDRRERRLIGEIVQAERREIRQRAQEEFHSRLAIATLQRRGQLPSHGSRNSFPFPRIGENESIRSYLQRRGELFTSHSGLRRNEVGNQQDSAESRGSGIPIAQPVPFTPGNVLYYLSVSLVRSH